MMLERIKPIINDFVIGKGLNSHERLVINGKLDLFANFVPTFGHRYNIRDDRYDMDLDEYGLYVHITMKMSTFL